MKHLVCLVIAIAAMAGASPTMAQQPSVLFCAPNNAGYGYVDFPYLRELNNAGFAVDYTDGFHEFVWSKLKNYNVLVLYMGPENAEAYNPSLTGNPAKTDAGFQATIADFISKGGGVLVISPETNISRQKIATSTLTAWDLQLPLQRIKENDAAKIAMMTRIRYQLARTTNILPSAVSAGVSNIWYPYASMYNSQATAPVLLGSSWTPVVRSSTTAITENVPLPAAYPTPSALPNPTPSSTSAPAIFGIRDTAAGRNGRMAFTAQWPSYSVGSGTRWLFNNEVLTGGLGGTASDFSRLIKNTLTWLAAPAIALGNGSNSSSVGGYVQNADRLLEPNYRSTAGWQTVEPTNNTVLDGTSAETPVHNPVYKGLIGAKTTYSSGTSTVQQYATAAQAAGLNFLVFTDDFSGLTQSEFDALKADCLTYSTSTLKLFPGYTIDNNVGDHMFFFGPSVTLPPSNNLVQPAGLLLYTQGTSSPGPQTATWQYSQGVGQGNVGFYNVHDGMSSGGVSMPDMRNSTLCALKYYKNGALVEDLAPEYLDTSAGTLPPGPISFNEIKSASALAAEVTSHAITYAQAPNIDQLFGTAANTPLRWISPYDGPNLFLSDGPIIKSWPATKRAGSFGSEPYATGLLFYPSLIAVEAAAGLKSVTLYDGLREYRKFELNGVTSWNKILHLEAATQKSLVMIVEDNNGKKAVSYARRSWKDGTEAITFCSDHMNDCKTGSISGPPLAAHGPLPLPSQYVPEVPDPGFSWDGGPVGNRPLLVPRRTVPVLKSSAGNEDGGLFRQTSYLNFSDEHAVGVTHLRNRKYSVPPVLSVSLGWAYGPTSPSSLMDIVQIYRSWLTPPVGPMPTGYEAMPQREGTKPNLFTNEITFKQTMNITELLLLQYGSSFVPSGSATLLRGYWSSSTSMATETNNLQSLPDNSWVVKSFLQNEWIAVYSPETSNTQVLINRGAPCNVVFTKITSTTAPSTWMFIYGVNQSITQPNQKLTYEIETVSFPVDTSPKNAADVQAQMGAYFNPSPISMIQGTRINGRYGVLDIQADNGIGEIIGYNSVAGRVRSTVPGRLFGLNPRWSAGVFLKHGFVAGHYGAGDNRFTPIGIDPVGVGHFGIPISWGDTQNMVVGHPIVADSSGQNLNIQVTHVNRSPQVWHVSVNNPTGSVVSSVLTKRMNLPGLSFTTFPVTLLPGQYMVIP